MYLKIQKGNITTQFKMHSTYQPPALQVNYSGSTGYLPLMPDVRPGVNLEVKKGNATYYVRNSGGGQTKTTTYYTTATDRYDLLDATEITASLSTSFVDSLTGTLGSLSWGYSGTREMLTYECAMLYTNTDQTLSRNTTVSKQEYSYTNSGLVSTTGQYDLFTQLMSANSHPYVTAMNQLFISSERGNNFYVTLTENDDYITTVSETISNISSQDESMSFSSSSAENAIDVVLNSFDEPLTMMYPVNWTQSSSFTSGSNYSHTGSVYKYMTILKAGCSAFTSQSNSEEGWNQGYTTIDGKRVMYIVNRTTENNTSCTNYLTGDVIGSVTTHSESTTAVTGYSGISYGTYEE